MDASLALGMLLIVSPFCIFVKVFVYAVDIIPNLDVEALATDGKHLLGTSLLGHNDLPPKN